MTLFAIIKGNTTFKDIYSWMMYNENNELLKEIFEKEQISMDNVHFRGLFGAFDSLLDNFSNFVSIVLSIS